MPYPATVRGERFSFSDLRELLAKANEQKSGDQLAGIAAASERERVAAKIALADVLVSEITIKERTTAAALEPGSSHEAFGARQTD